MKKIIKIALPILLLFGMFIPAMAQDAQYIGVDKCKMCHKGDKKGNQYEIWQESVHAKAFETLKSEESQKIATEKGLAKPAHEAPECLKCHVTGHDADASKLSSSFKMEEGVQCETCHGAGSEYKSMSIMRDRAKAIEAGMTDILVENGTAEKQCLECHNEESPTYKPFDFKARWEEIKHPRP